MADLVVGGLYQCWVSDGKAKRVITVRVLSIAPFGGGVKVVFQDARKPGRKMERYSTLDFRPVA